MPEPSGLPPNGATLELLQNQSASYRRARPPDLENGFGHVDRVPLRPEVDSKMRRRESRLGLRNIFGRHKNTDKSPQSPVSATPPASTEPPRLGGIRASLAEINWPYSLSQGNGQRSEIALPSFGLQSAASLKHRKSASIVRTQPPPTNARGSLATWDPPPLFKAYPQAIKHSHLPACTTSAEAILRLHKGSFSQGTVDTMDEPGSEKGDKAKKRHRRNTSGASLKLEWTTKVFVLVTSGYLLQYAGDGSFDRLPEKVLHLGKDSAAFASDLIPGRHWVLQVSSVAEPDRTATPHTPSLLSRFPFRGQERRQAANLLMVFESAEEMDSWITTLRREIEALGGRKYLSETGKPKLDDIETQLRSQTSQRTLVVRDPDRFSRTMSPELPWDHMEGSGIHLDLTESDMRDQSFDDTSTASGISHDGRQLDGLRDSTHRLSYISSGQRTVITSAGSSPACSPIRDSFLSAEDAYVPDMHIHEEPRPRARPNAAAINDRRQSLQTVNHMFDMRVASAQNLRPYSTSSANIWHPDSTAALYPLPQTIPNFSVPQGMGKRYSVTRPISMEPLHSTTQTLGRMSGRRAPPTALAINGRPLSLVEDQPSPMSPPYSDDETSSALPSRHNWADDVEIDETVDELPPPQKIQNKDGTTTIIEYHYNDKDQKVKTTRRIRFITHREVVNPRVAERKSWAKFGLSAKDGPGPAADTTTVGENIIFKPSTNWRKDAKDESKDANAQAMKDKLKDKKVKCRICNGEHFTARCPYKDTMAPIGEAAAGGSQADADDLAGRQGTGEGTAGAGKKGSYVPPALRGDRGASQGDRMGGSKYGERDDLATLRVTNVSEMAEENELRDMFERFGRVTRVFLAKDRDTGMAKGFAFISFADRTDAVKACAKMDGFGFKHLILRVEFAKKAQ
ncbi:eukaryotic translation initiation factor 3 subunit G-domain-containing protein [Echria macrotheca]|uniref:Eukaryotic translation initiation factor 3 subunit G n=1 Tax=Echria macrotheca TaxID=438768 RepID=A0AAJ0BDR1_9PEZI|nr:eukaryotic translation initiation factor 3 subunit G-domain-containing protein [Echria macrotheca]